MPRERLRAEIKLRGRRDREVLEASIPPEVASELGASDGDVLLVERGSMSVAEKAAVQGVDLVVTLKREPPSPAAAPPATRPAPSPVLTETLEETIKRLKRLRNEQR